jgi:magnesium-transporting ATPase (P-type)
MRDIDVDSITGLSSADVSRKLNDEGFNELPSSGKRSIFGIAFNVIKEPIFLLLVASGSIYFILGDVTEGIVLLSNHWYHRLSGAKNRKGVRRPKKSFQPPSSSNKGRRAKEDSWTRSCFKRYTYLIRRRPRAS